MNPERLRRAPNIAIVGSTSPVGKELKEMIEESGFPVGRTLFLETEEYAGLLQEFSGEIQVTQVISPLALSDVDITFFACGPEILRAYAASDAPFPELSIDLTQAGQPGTLYLHGISNPALLRETGYFINPHPATIALTPILSRLETEFGIEGAEVTLMEPASERGSSGIEELQEQTIGLLNFQTVGSRIFAGQIAFNIRADDALAAGSETVVGGQLEEMLGRACVPLIRAVQSPVFHSHAFSVFVHLKGAPDGEAVRHCLAKSPAILQYTDGRNPTPVDVIGTEQVHLGRIVADSRRSGSFSLWAVADNLRLPASNALRMAEALMFSPASQR